MVYIRFQHRDISILLILLLSCLSWLDVITTRFGLEQGYQELNPVLAPYVGEPAFFLLIKFLGIILILILAIISRWITPSGDHVVLTSVCGINLLPVAWNCSILAPLIILF